MSYDDGHRSIRKNYSHPIAMQFCHHAHDMICFYPRDPYSATVSRPVREQDTVKIVLTFLPHDTQERKVLRSDLLMIFASDKGDDVGVTRITLKTEVNPRNYSEG